MRAPISLALILTQVNLPSPLPGLLFKLIQPKSTQSSIFVHYEYTHICCVDCRQKKACICHLCGQSQASIFDGEVFSSKDEVTSRLKDWSCYLGFAAVLGHDEYKKRQIQWILCHRHGKKTRKTNKLTEKTRSRSLTHVNYNECPYKVKIRYYKNDSKWRINVVNDTHSHDMLDDSFQLTEHYPRDPDRV